LLKHTPLRYELVPLYLDLGWHNDIKPVQDFCRDSGLELLVEPVNIGRVVFEQRQEKNPCALCANLRRGALVRVAKAQNCNKLALGHHLDDAVNTLFLSMLYERRLRLFKPSTYMSRQDITVIRPLVYVEEKDIVRFCAYLNIVPVKNNCPADGATRRSEVSLLLEQMEKNHPGAKRKILESLENIDPGSFWNY